MECGSGPAAGCASTRRNFTAKHSIMYADRRIHSNRHGALLLQAQLLQVRLRYDLKVQVVRGPSRRRKTLAVCYPGR